MLRRLRNENEFLSLFSPSMHGQSIPLFATMEWPSPEGCSAEPGEPTRFASPITSGRFFFDVRNHSLDRLGPDVEPTAALPGTIATRTNLGVCTAGRNPCCAFRQ